MDNKEKHTSPYDAALLKKIADCLIHEEATVAVAESITSGCLQVAFSQAQGATRFFQGGITAYQGAHKTRLLEVEPIHGAKNEFVNSLVATEMAIAVCKLFISHYAIGITGFAVPLPNDDRQYPYAYYAFVKEGKLLKSGIIEMKQKPVSHVQEEFTQTLLVLFLQLLEWEK